MYLEKDFIDEKFPKKVHDSIFKKVGSEYYNKIFSKYDIDRDQQLENIPIWEFLEIITFGELVNFYEFFSREYNLKNGLKNIFILREIVKLRNAVAHNIIHVYYQILIEKIIIMHQIIKLSIF